MPYPTVPPSPTPRSPVGSNEPQLQGSQWGRGATPATCARPALASAILIGLLFLVAFLNSGRDDAGHLNTTQTASTFDTSRQTTPQPEK